MRWKADPADVVPLGDGPALKAARIMGLSTRDFERLLPAYVARGFPSPDLSIGLFDLDAIVQWRRHRFPELYGLTAPNGARDARGLVAKRLTEMGRVKHPAG